MEKWDTPRQIRLTFKTNIAFHEFYDWKNVSDWTHFVRIHMKKTGTFSVAKASFPLIISIVHGTLRSLQFKPAIKYRWETIIGPCKPKSESRIPPNFKFESRITVCIFFFFSKINPRKLLGNLNSYTGLKFKSRIQPSLKSESPESMNPLTVP